MSRDARLRLAHIVEACERIAQYIQGIEASSFDGDLKTQDAVIRQFEVIGEAVKALPPAMIERERVFLLQRGLTKVYTTGEVEVRALDGVDIDLYHGELIVLPGASGSGQREIHPAQQS